MNTQPTKTETLPITDQQHPITPPPELVQQWLEEADTFRFLVKQVHQYVAERAAQWGFDQANADIERERQEAADEELEACRQWLEINGAPRKLIDGLLVARCCYGPLSLKEQALEVLRQLENGEIAIGERADTIRRALEQLPTGDS